jgi:hypothetical protein
LSSIDNSLASGEIGVLSRDGNLSGQILLFKRGDNSAGSSIIGSEDGLEIVFVFAKDVLGVAKCFSGEPLASPRIGYDFNRA